MIDIDQKFESLGANCEFGFFLRHRSDDNATLFKWSEIPRVESLIRFINAGFSNILEDGHVKPFSRGMVLDQNNGIAWHSKAASSIIDKSKPPLPSNLQFEDNDSVLSEILSDNREKLNHLARKTRNNLRSGSRIYVFKPHFSDVQTPDHAENLSKALNAYGPNKLLYVVRAIEPNMAGSIARVNDSLYLGYIDRFANPGTADVYSASAWERICESALNSMSTTRHHSA